MKLASGLVLFPLHIPGFISCHAAFTIVPSPSRMLCSRNTTKLFFQNSSRSSTSRMTSPLRHLTVDPDEAAIALVIENRSEKAITALRWRWLKSDASGNIRNNTCSSDSYMVDVFRAVVEPGSRRLISRSANLDESIIDHVLAGGGVVGAKVTGLRPFLENVAERRLKLISSCLPTEKSPALIPKNTLWN